jgi:hypothetical protein
MINLEWVVTLISVIVMGLIFLIITIRRSIQTRRLNHDIDLLVAAGSGPLTEKDFVALKRKLKSGNIQKESFISATFIIQTVFGCAVLGGFSWWAYGLFQQNAIELGSVSVLIALTGLILPILAWSEIEERNLKLGQIDAALSTTESALIKQPVKIHAVDKPDVKVFQTSEKSVSVEQVPEDSILKRHYLANKAAEREALISPYPTDSVLRRHYDTKMKTWFEESVQKLASSKPAFQQVIKPKEKAQKIPEDSVLRRHFLNQLQSEIEDSLCPRPTDSVLKRHYDTLVASELDKRLTHLK